MDRLGASDNTLTNLIKDAVQEQPSAQPLCTPLLKEKIGKARPGRQGPVFRGRTVAGMEGATISLFRGTT